MPLFIPYKSNYIGDKNLISTGVVELGSHDLESHFGVKHLLCKFSLQYMKKITYIIHKI